MVRASTPVLLLALAASSVAAQNATVNWVGPKIGRPIDTACYRKTLRNNECPLGYDSDKLGGCWAQCPLEYPVACGMECIPQSKDCGLEVITKIGTVATVAINLASSSMFSSLVGANVQAGLKCGGDLFTVVTKIVQVVGDIQKANPTITDAQLILQLLQSSVVTSDLTSAVTTCAGSSSSIGSVISTIVNFIVGQVATNKSAVLEPNAFIQLTKDAGVGSSITALGSSDLDKFKQLIANGPACGMQLKNNGNPVPPEYYALVAVNLGLDALSGLDSTGIVKMVQEFLQPICGPTSMIGEIDDGPANLALGLRTVDAAFNGSYGQWNKAGSGQVKIIFESNDTLDVTVNVWSGGSQIASVPVAKGGRAEWTKPVKDLQDKTLYLDRWRPGFWGLPGTGGGSLLAWVPRSSTGGNFELHAVLNVS